jgi:hypothetical protein
VVAPFRLRLGDAAPPQQSPTTCGAACLTVARMIANPAFATWVRTGVAPDGREDSGSTALDRFAACEQVVASRTNATVGAGGRLQVPWPRPLGTPPWGALHELEWGASDPRADYDLVWLRLRGRAARHATYDQLLERVGPGRPALLYVGDRWLPRHVVLVLPPTGDPELDVYEPSAGGVVGLGRDEFVARRLALSGWDVPWAVISARISAGG